ncbi:hypothetical protein [Nitrospirillum pindoramense]|uniref:Uncharacterized protein n=1 Tax=Nitrospirillum amazonense TaxID=28077 RepID=A0A560HFW9_9PROT|nr:hypothetical protein [Nitrospirillum amazonense]TWB44509.1 hypothetical protein FBZ90_103417 [Nitrospirillum amazonense]
MLNDNLFGQSYDQIKKAVYANQSANFQILGTPVAYNFSTPGPNQMDPGLYQFVSVMPVWSALGTFGQNGTTLFSAYRQLLSNVTFKIDPGKQADLAQQQSQLNGLYQQQTQVIANTTQAYNVQLANGGDLFKAMYPTIQAWLAGPGSTYQTQINGLTTSINTLSNKYTSDLAAILGGDQTLQQAMNAIQTPSNTPAQGAPPPGWIAVPNSGGVLQWQPEFVVNPAPAQVTQTLSQGSLGGFTVTLDSSVTNNSLSQAWAGGNVSYGNSFFSVNAGGNWSSLNIDQSDTSVKVEISVKSSMLVTVTPGVWYDGGFLANLAQNTAGGGGYQLASTWSVAGNPPSAFGQNGLVSTNVAQLVVVYQPSATVTMSQQTFQRNYQMFQGGGGISIGPFTFGGNGGSVKDYTLTTNGSTNFTATSTSTLPQIVGIGVGFPGVGQPE